MSASDDLLYITSQLVRLELDRAEAQAVARSMVRWLTGDERPEARVVGETLLRRYPWLRGEVASE